MTPYLFACNNRPGMKVRMRHEGVAYVIAFNQGLYIMPDDVPDREAFVEALRRLVVSIPGVYELSQEQAEAIMREPEPEAPQRGVVGGYTTEHNQRPVPLPQEGADDPESLVALQQQIKDVNEKTKLPERTDPNYDERATLEHKEEIPLNIQF